MIAIDIAVPAAVWRDFADAEQLVRRAVETALADAGRDDVELGIVLTDDAHMQSLNRTWRGTDRPTNVLSFPAAQAANAPTPLLGDIVFAYETVAREAREQSIRPEHHLTHLAVHGVLHLLGHDHATDAEAEQMERREQSILRQLGVPDPFRDRIRDE